MSVVLVTGGSGTFGRKLVPLLAERGHDVRIVSRRPGAGTHVGDLTTGAGIAEAAAGAELIVHAATDNSFRAGRTDLVQTQNLLAAATGCRHLLYISIVGIDDIPFGYYQRKLACEQAIAASSVPSTTLRATQFHELIEKMLRTVSRWPAAPLPLSFRFQSVAAAEVAARAAGLLDAEPTGRAPDFGGPQVLTGRQIVADWRAARGRPRAVIGVRLPGEVARAFTQGRNTCPGHANGRQTWAEFLAQT
ncbi:MAG TPA: SDR family oxidoreductase [Streptosporangiaceae bacterium]|nr:SDR family oxidoreductase [Streptosporangiaceae bacterium]